MSFRRGATDVHSILVENVYIREKSGSIQLNKYEGKGNHAVVVLCCTKLVRPCRILIRHNGQSEFITLK